MKLLFTLFLSITWISVSSQCKVKVSGQIFNAGVDSIYISQFNGATYKDYLGSKLDKKGNFSINGTLPAIDYYVLRVGRNHVNIILKDSSDIKVYGDGTKLKSFCNFIGSSESQNMHQFASRLEQWNVKNDSAVKAMNVADTSQKRKINEYMSREYYQFLNDRQQFVADNPNSPALIVALVSINVENEYEAYVTILNQLITCFGASPTIQEYTKYVNSLNAKKAEEKKQLEAANLLAPGKKAPEFEEFTVDRKSTLKLSNLKGSIVLIDFWASWCGPCRRENPNVVKTYEKYKADGFTIVSVSLDTDLQKWLAAIKQDNLTWPHHVSDLGGWNSKVPKQYQVGSVPFTVLLDQEGNVIQTNLRGPALEEALAKIYGH